ncbi:hypothetical protein EHO60_00910 [Leptospira fletcheri]|uniref:Uncharacterized protein n=1 Tax=Leptospira fletcheri TaxID=2484981 RepID=A0A4R9GJP3_9LEPT|nr:hypothetical protein [Leptospira fletcheri]TGK13938.1 hypothetical protein EHO60_00910 [Leptospira fletcheri]
MSEARRIEDALKGFLENPQGRASDSDEAFSSLLLEFCELLFAEEEDDREKMSLSNLGSFELDEFFHFYLPDMHPGDVNIQKKVKDFLKRFRKYLEKKNLLSKAQSEDWKEFFQENGI